MSNPDKKIGLKLRLKHLLRIQKFEKKSNVRKRLVILMTVLIAFTLVHTSISLYLGKINSDLSELSRLKNLEYILATEMVDAFEFYRDNEMAASNRARLRAAEGIIAKGKEYFATINQVSEILNRRTRAIEKIAWPKHVNHKSLLPSDSTITSFTWTVNFLDGRLGSFSTNLYAPPEEVVILQRRLWRTEYFKARDVIVTELNTYQNILSSWMTAATSVIVIAVFFLYTFSVQPVLVRIAEANFRANLRAELHEEMSRFLQSANEIFQNLHELDNLNLVKFMNTIASAEKNLKDTKFILLDAIDRDINNDDSSLIQVINDQKILDGVLYIDIPSNLRNFNESFLSFIGALSANINFFSEARLRMQVESQRDALHILTEKALESIPQAVGVFGNDGSCVIANKSFREHCSKYFGTTFELHNVDIIDKINHKIMQSSLQDQKNIKDGSKVGSHLQTTAQYDDDIIFSWTRSQVYELGVIFLAQDVTKIYDDATTIAHKRRLEALGRISGTIVHDSNNLLAVVQGSIEMIMMDKGLSENSRGFAVKAINAVGQSQEMARRLLSFSRKGDSYPEIVKLQDSIEEINMYLSGSSYRCINFEKRMHDKDSCIFVDPSMFSSALLNIVVNSAQAMDGVGKILLETMWHDDDSIMLRISDDGPGFSLAALENGRVEFFTEKSIGTGLGLSAVDSFVAQSNGHLSLYNSKHGGAVVEMVLPRANGDRMEAPNKYLLNGELINGEINILIVEDNRELCNLVENFLSQRGLHVVKAYNVTEAKIAIAKRNYDFDFIISDVNLPDGNGLDFVNECLIHNDKIAIIVITGYVADGSDLLTDFPNVTILKKPFVLFSLWNAIEKFCHDMRVSRN